MSRGKDARPFNIAIAGLGTVGGGVARLLAENADLLAARCGRPLRLVAVSARDRGRDRGLDLGAVRWVDNARALAAAEGVDLLVEAIGGADGIALDLAERSLAIGRHLVTANKALIAHHGHHLAVVAEASGATLAFEGAVAGGIPVIEALRGSLAGNRLSAVYGILNGTCNYLLSGMAESGRPFQTVLEEAQALGYAEADPGFDIDGIDAAHKIAILAALAFGARVDFKAGYTEGVRAITPDDIKYAAELGYRIKLLGLARLVDGRLEQRVHPCLVDARSPIARVDGVLNAVVAQGDFAGQTVFEGSGAGAGPTASAVVGDIVRIVRGGGGPAFSLPADQLASLPRAPMEDHCGASYVRLRVLDKPGVIADISAILRDSSVSLESLIQRGRAPDAEVAVVMVTHECRESAMQAALCRIAGLATVTEPPLMIRIEEV